MKKPGVGVAIGRFQVHDLHPGHLALMRKADEHSKLLIFICVSPHLVTPSDPLDYPAREQMVRQQFPHAMTAPLPDNPTDAGWSEAVDRWLDQVCPTDVPVIYFGRDSSRLRYLGRCRTSEIDSVPHVSGTDIRAEVGKTVECTKGWRAGVIYAAHNMWSRAVPVVDIAITRPITDRATLHGRGRQVLVGRRSIERGRCRFPGGHVNISDDSAAAAARRELAEETGLEAGALEFIDNLRVRSWADAVGCAYFTTFFHTEYLHGAAAAADDLDALDWVDVERLKHLEFADSHALLADKLVQFLERKATP